MSGRWRRWRMDEKRTGHEERRSNREKETAACYVGRTKEKRAARCASKTDSKEGAREWEGGGGGREGGGRRWDGSVLVRLPVGHLRCKFDSSRPYVIRCFDELVALPRPDSVFWCAFRRCWKRYTGTPHGHTLKWYYSNVGYSLRTLVDRSDLTGTRVRVRLHYIASLRVSLPPTMSLVRTECLVTDSLVRKLPAEKIGIVILVFFFYFFIIIIFFFVFFSLFSSPLIIARDRFSFSSILRRTTEDYRQYRRDVRGLCKTSTGTRKTHEEKAKWFC
ncbi:uncharacterized protein LOC143143582 [Ptiloglossa arizonensis]|uniref:uncharacterized protein LOC143143582 n=1 Tax=Ptiloglossa arizonensis TaxID=3350558 RepID=UPI003F9F70AB